MNQAFRPDHRQPYGRPDSAPWLAGRLHQVDGLICTATDPTTGDCDTFQPGRPDDPQTLEKLADHICRPKKASEERTESATTAYRTGKPTGFYGSEVIKAKQ